MTTLAEPSLTVGYGIQSRGEFDALPDGTVLRYDGVTTARFEKRNGQWITEAGRTYNKNFFTLGGQNVIESLPEPGAKTDTVRLAGVRLETLEQFKQWFRTTTYGVQQRAGVSARPLDRAMGKLAVPDHEPSVGMMVFGQDLQLLRRLPRGTVLATGNPREVGTHGVIGWDGYNTVGLLGQSDCYGNVFRVLNAPGLEEAEWAKASGTPESIAEVLAFKREAWNLGVQAKNENGWCGEYENAMAYVGITSAVLEEQPAMLTPEEVAALPVGSILRFVCTSGSALYRRSEGADNPAGTKRIGGLPGDWCSMPVTCAYDPSKDQNMWIKIHNLAEMNSVPVGTGMGEIRSRTAWTVIGKHSQYPLQNEWRQADGRYTYPSNQFGIGTLHYTEFPAEETPAPTSNDLEF